MEHVNLDVSLSLRGNESDFGVVSWCFRSLDLLKKGGNELVPHSVEFCYKMMLLDVLSCFYSIGYRSSFFC